jgi:glycine/D-amino acid oxidase-like deaminating enzyme
MRMRFPAMAESPLLESRVCQYENPTDHNFILDHHPEAENVLIVGGGSGHGFKHGPVIGEMVADAVLEIKAPPIELGSNAHRFAAYASFPVAPLLQQSHRVPFHTKEQGTRSAKDVF